MKIVINPKCTQCDGKGYVYVRTGEDEVDTDPCDCVLEANEQEVTIVERIGRIRKLAEEMLKECRK